MSFYHERKYLHRGYIIEITCSHNCTVMLLDDINFKKFKEHGMYACENMWTDKESIIKIRIPSTHSWNIVIEPKKEHADFTHSMKVITDQL